ncbi:hypothetical protein Tco_1526838, partial [Tanacetum coccineum]
VKKAYKLYSVESEAVFFLRDVTFYETIFPLKMKSESEDKHVLSESQSQSSMDSPHHNSSHLVIDEATMATQIDEDNIPSKGIQSEILGFGSSPSSVRYGLEKYVSYSALSAMNLCFDTTFNKSTEPKSYVEAT